MRKFVFTALAAGALAVAGAAGAQDFATIINNAMHNETYQPPVENGPPVGAVYSDQYGRQVYRDSTGREVLVQSRPGSYGIVGHDAWGRPVYGQVAAANPRWDRDGDGIANRRDRYPDDPRYR